MLISRIPVEQHLTRYTFLDKEHLLVYSVLPKNDSQSTRMALLIYRIPRVPMDNEVPANIDFCPCLYPSHEPILIFELPELHPTWEFAKYHSMLDSKPLPGDVVYAKSATLLCSHVTALRLGFQIWNNPHQRPYKYGSRKGTPTGFRVFVSTHHLFTHLTRHQSEGVMIIPFSQWGTATRWFIEDDSMEYSVDRIYRSQYIRSTTAELNKTQLVSIVDFNPPVIKRNAFNYIATSRTKCVSVDEFEETAVLEGRGMTAGSLFQPWIASTELSVATLGESLNQEVLTETIGSDMKTIIEVGFKDPVVSCLPYRVVTKSEVFPEHGHWMIHGEYLVGIVSLTNQSELFEH